MAGKSGLKKQCPVCPETLIFVVGVFHYCPRCRTVYEKKRWGYQVSARAGIHAEVARLAERGSLVLP